jgi:hypothetical protein
MVSMTLPANVKRVRIYDTTPKVVAGTDNELNPTEPTLDLYLPETNKASGRSNRERMAHAGPALHGAA